MAVAQPAFHGFEQQQAALHVSIAPSTEYFLGIAGYGMAITFLSHTYLLYPYILLALVITHYHIINDDHIRTRELA